MIVNTKAGSSGTRRTQPPLFNQRSEKLALGSLSFLLGLVVADTCGGAVAVAIWPCLLGEVEYPKIWSSGFDKLSPLLGEPFDRLRYAPEPGDGSCAYWPLYFLATASASFWPLFSASSTLFLPAMTAEMSWLTLVPRSVNSGMSTNWMPTVGRGCTPGLTGSADSMAFSVASAKAPAAFLYSGLA